MHIAFQGSDSHIAQLESPLCICCWIESVQIIVGSLHTWSSLTTKFFECLRQQSKRGKIFTCVQDQFMKQYEINLLVLHVLIFLLFSPLQCHCIFRIQVQSILYIYAAQDLSFESKLELFKSQLLSLVV